MSAAMPSEPTLAGWDCHAHVFGPYARYPLAADRSYTPPEAPVAAYRQLLHRLGLAHGVLVQPSAYGSNHQLLLDGLAQSPDLRGVAVVRVQDAQLCAQLRQLRTGGVRGLRFSHRSGAGGNFAGSATLDDLAALAPAMADAGLHAELWTDCTALPLIADALRALPVPVVIDHMGGFDVQAGVAAPGFQCLLRLLGAGRAWVKLCAYRNLLGQADPDVGRAFQQALVAANPKRLVWGSDWPHLRVQPVPDAADWLARFRQWTSDPALQGAIVQTNPGELYL